jgi:hypothetical protein
MLILRLLFVLLVIVSIVFLGFYLLYDDRKYLQFFKQTLKLSLYLAVLIGIVFVLRGLL